jgi:drug/metabolite transporter (DMT)-like permease
LLTIIFGLSAALSWGSSDFTGGLVSRRAGAIRATLYMEVFGILPLLLLSWFSDGLRNSTPNDWLWCGLAGVIGSLGQLGLYKALADGKMSIAAPVTALTSASVPIIAGGIRDGWPPVLTLAGFAIGLFATWLLSQSNSGASMPGIHFSDIGLPLLAGLGMGFYFILINHGSRTDVFVPLLAVRLGATIALLTFAFFSQQLILPSRSMVPLVITNTVFDIGGGLFYILAGQVGRMDVAVLLGSLYSGVTVLLAWLIVGEKINRKQWLGVILILLAILFLAQ